MKYSDQWKAQHFSTEQSQQIPIEEIKTALFLKPNLAQPLKVIFIVVIFLNII